MQAGKEGVGGPAAGVETGVDIGVVADERAAGDEEDRGGRVAPSQRHPLVRRLRGRRRRPPHPGALLRRGTLRSDCSSGEVITL